MFTEVLASISVVLSTVAYNPGIETSSPKQHCELPVTIQLVDVLEIKEDLDLQEITETVSEQLLKETYDFDDSVIEDVMYVATRTGVDPTVIGSIVDQESGGRRDVLNYCKKWGKPRFNERKDRWEKECQKRASCYHNCRANHIWRNHLDVGLWGLRDVVERVGGPENSRRFAGWSWVRSYRRTLPEEERRTIRPDCTLDRMCSREMAIHAIRTFKSEQERLKNSRIGRANCRGVPDNWKWLGFWNGCSSARNHTDKARKMQAKRGVRVHIIRFLHHIQYATRTLGDFPLFRPFKDRIV